MLYSFRIIPDRGSWIEAQFDTSDLLYVYLDRKKRRRKFLTTTFFRALGYGTDEEILKLFYNDRRAEVEREAREERLANKVLIEDAVDGEGTGRARFRAAVQSGGQADLALGIKEVKVDRHHRRRRSS